MRPKSPIKGFRLSTTLGWRNAKPGDKYVESAQSNGADIPSNYVVFVKIKDCVITKQLDGRLTYNSDNAPAIPISGHGLTSKAYGARKFVKKPFYQEVHIPVYMAYDGRVYTSRIKRKIYTGKIRPANAEETTKFPGVEYVIDLGDEYTGVPVLHRSIKLLQQKGIDFLNQIIEWEERSGEGHIWAEYFNL